MVLVTLGADVNARGRRLERTPLHEAAALGHAEVAAALLESGCAALRRVPRGGHAGPMPVPVGGYIRGGH
jgi:ankyrin repeat protein